MPKKKQAPKKQATKKQPSAFGKSLFEFLMDLEENNEREWFEANKERYESHVREPARAFIRLMEPKLKKISPHFVADDRKAGGSLMRVHRDIRFSKDKRPYKTNVGIQFRHELGKDVHSPGYYVHLHADESFLAAGIWHPPSEALAAIREAIDNRPGDWKKARDDAKFRKSFTLEGDSLKKPPRGYDKDHPLLDDLKRKDFIAVMPLKRTHVVAADFLTNVQQVFQSARPLMRFLCRAIAVPF